MVLGLFLYCWALNGLGSTSAQAGRLNQSKIFWEKALNINPSFSAPLFNSGLAHRALGNTDKALSCLIWYKNLPSHHLSPSEQKKLIALLVELQN